MAFNYFSKNGKVLPIEEASISLSSIEYSYGFGVYETLRASNGQIYFLKDHIERLMESAKIIGLEHSFTEDFIKESIGEIIRKNEIETCNIKMLLIGAPSKEEAQLFIICLNPLFPDKNFIVTARHLLPTNMSARFPSCQNAKYVAELLSVSGSQEIRSL